MFCVVFILFVISSLGARGWVVDTFGNGGGSIPQGLSFWPTAGLFWVPDLHLQQMLLMVS